MPERGGPGRVAVVTDSTASLSAHTAAQHGITVVPLRVVVGDASYDEGGAQGLTADDIAEALRSRTPVSTSRPNPGAFQQVYERLAGSGVAEVVSVHLSAELSGTYESAQLAARSSPVPVTVVDSRQVGMGTGYAVLAAADAVAAGSGASEAAEVARTRAGATTSLFYVDTLEYLRRGGRVGALGALVGSALAVKPILTVDDGRVVPHERVRTSTRALARLEELAFDAVGASSRGAAGTGRVDVAVAHLASRERAVDLAGRLESRLEGVTVRLVEIGAVLGAHAGPGMVAVAVAPRG